MDTGEKPTYDRHDVHFSARVNLIRPVIILFGFPAILLLLFLFGIYVWSSWSTFLAANAAFMYWMGIVIQVVVVVLLTWATIRLVVHPLIESYRRMGVARQAHVAAEAAAMRKIVLIEHEQYSVLIHPRTRELQVIQLQQERVNWNVRVPQTQIREESDLPRELAAPTLYRSGREVILAGHVQTALAQGCYLLGYGEDGRLKKVRQEHLFNLILAGIPGSGKSTTALWLAGQRMKAGGLYMASDPHLQYQHEDGRHSLGHALVPFSKSRLIETDDGSTAGVLTKLGMMLRELDKRQKQGYVVRSHDTWLWIIDDINNVIDAMVAEQKIEQFSMGLARLQRDGRKFGLHTMLMGHRFSQSDIGRVRIRSVASNILEHKMTDANQARVLLGPNGARALDLSVGDYLLSGIMADKIERIHTPAFPTADLPLLFDDTGLGGGTGVPGAVPMQFPPTSNPLPQSGGVVQSAFVDPVLAALDQGKLSMMIRMVLDESSQNEIIGAVFPGMRTQTAHAEYRKYLAAIMRLQLRSNVPTQPLPTGQGGMAPDSVSGKDTTRL